MDNIIIRIDDGDTFEGTISQFKDCFFTNADIGTITYWCKMNNMKLEIIEKEKER